MRMHICVFLCTGVFFAVQVIKTGKGFSVFLIGEEILKTRDWNILNFELKKKKSQIFWLWKMEPHFCSHFESRVHL